LAVVTAWAIAWAGPGRLGREATAAALGVLGWATALCWLQASVGVCVLLARRGLMDLDRGPVPIVDAAALHAARAESRRIWVWAIGVGAAVGVGFWGLG
jgi:hypothetical protein